MSGYFDAAAGLPLSAAGRQALLAALDDGWADPSRLYGAARRARLLLDGARESVAASLAVRPDEVSFTPSGTLAAHLAVLGTLAGRAAVGGHVVQSAVEHSCVLSATEHAAADVSTVAVDAVGRVDAPAFGAALRPDTALACLISASHEVGTVQPVAAVAAACHEARVPLLVDAAQSVGRVSVPAGWSLLTASARKWGGPTGVGVLVVRTGTRWRSPLPPDEREGGRVPGAPSLPLVLSAAVALESALTEADAEQARLRRLVDRLREQIPRTVPDVEVVGDPADRLPHLMTFSCLYLDGESLLSALDREGFAVSSGSSCTASTLEPSHVLAAMGALTSGNIRVSLSRETTEQDVDRFLSVLPGVVAGLRRDAGADDL
ncbi:MAG: aminotransferase class [Frankiales bacterium]|jgi:cysteine desulfurase|nr:aminotransferase class [Frankiales bacterium]